MKKLPSSFLAIFLALTLWTALGIGAASAQTVYVVGTNNTFGRFDLGTRQYTQISASLGGGNTYNLTSNGAGGFFATQNADSTGFTNDTFIRLSLTGTVTQIGANAGVGDVLLGLARRPADGTLFAYGSNGGSIGTVNPTTGGYTAVGTPGKAAAGFGGDLAFIGLTLYATSSSNSGGLYTVNTNTGAFSTQIGASNSTYVSSVVFSNGAKLYLLNGTTLYSVDTGSGVLTSLGALLGADLPGGFYGAAVPEPSTWAMLGLGAAGAGVVALRRRQAVKG